jgi:ATP-dependent DNA helicase 2 subunit 1
VAAATFDLGEGSFWRELIGSVRQHYKPGASRPAPAEGGGVGSSESGADGTTPTSSAVFAEDKSDAWLETCIASDPESLLARVRRAAHRKRVLWQSSLSVRDGYAISFEMVSLVRKYSKPTAKKLDARTNEELISQTSMMCTQHGSTLSKQDVFRGYNFGGKWVYFDASELADFGHEDARGGIVPNGLTLLGFKDAEALKIHHNLGAAKFLQPTERAAGSTMAMAALVQAMITKKKIGIARMAKGKVSISRLVALLPQPRVEAGSDAGGGGGGRSLPCGLHLIPLPYAEDIRSVSKPAAMRESDFSSEKLEAARRLVTALQLPSEKNPVGTIPNPATSVHYNYLQVLALNVPGAEVAETIDGTLPDSAWLAHREPEMAAFRKAFELPDIDGAEALAGGPAKRQRTAAPKEEKLSLSGSSPMAEWVAAHMQGRLSTLTNPTLKEFLKEHGLPVGGKKDDLIARVHDFIELTIAQDAAQGEAK